MNLWLNKMSKSPFFTSSERNLLIAHNTIASRIKAFKRNFIRKGQMMKTLDYINSLHKKSDYIAIARVSQVLEQTMPPHWVPRHFKYMELISYCLFLQEYRTLTDPNDIVNLTNSILGTLNMGHELGRAIERSVRLCVT